LFQTVGAQREKGRATMVVDEKCQRVHQVYKLFACPSPALWNKYWQSRFQSYSYYISCLERLMPTDVSSATTLWLLSRDVNLL